MLTTIRKQNPFNPVLSDFFGTNFLNDSEWNSSPAVNIAEDNNGFKIEVAAPGFDKDDFSINVEKRVLEISSKKESSVDNKDEKVHRKEFFFRNFRRTFSLPELVDTENIAASYSNGILTVSIPKREEAKDKPARQIAIQ
jgi:HSP20 family protein